MYRLFYLQSKGVVLLFYYTGTVGIIIPAPRKLTICYRGVRGALGLPAGALRGETVSKVPATGYNTQAEGENGHGIHQRRKPRTDNIAAGLHMNRIRSSWRLGTESNRNLELLWLLGKLSPDHKTVAEFRRQNGETLKQVFKGFVKLGL
jgi:hypothetical protein